MKYFRVKTGFKESDFVTIDETQLEKALTAQITGKVAIFPNASISGNSIITITPDYHEALGFKPDAVLRYEDYAHIEPEYMRSLELAKTNYDRLEAGLPRIEELPRIEGGTDDIVKRLADGMQP